MNYELVITRTQPSCGGKSPKAREIREITTDDVIAYVRASEPSLPKDTELNAVKDDKGIVNVEFQSGAETVTYEFATAQ